MSNWRDKLDRMNREALEKIASRLAIPNRRTLGKRVLQNRVANALDQLGQYSASIVHNLLDQWDTQASDIEETSEMSKSSRFGPGAEEESSSAAQDNTSNPRITPRPLPEAASPEDAARASPVETMAPAPEAALAISSPAPASPAPAEAAASIPPEQEARAAGGAPEGAVLTSAEDVSGDEAAVFDPAVASKYFLAEEEAAAVADFDPPGELPGSYARNMIYSLVRDPRTIYFWWDLDRTVQDHLYFNRTARLRVSFERAGLHAFHVPRFEPEKTIEFHGGPGEYYFAAEPGHVYRARLWLAAASGGEHLLGESNWASTPPEEISTITEDIFNRFPDHVPYLEAMTWWPLAVSLMGRDAARAPHSAMPLLREMLDWAGAHRMASGAQPSAPVLPADSAAWPVVPPSAPEKPHSATWFLGGSERVWRGGASEFSRGLT
ncbi:MAG: hypothetical protein GMKNLPBB_00303 [Myxococcota bacterium]|nr:hypothetical protein [Myxococcota bacterium]